MEARRQTFKLGVAVLFAASLPLAAQLLQNPSPMVEHKRAHSRVAKSAKRKVSVVLELLYGAGLESTSRKYRVTAATLIEWRGRFLAGGENSLKSRESGIEDEQKRRLKPVVAGVSVENELLREKIARLDNGRPLVSWKWKP